VGGGGSPTFDNLTVKNPSQSIISLESDTGLLQLFSEDATSQKAYLYNGTTGDQDFTIDVYSPITNKGINFVLDGISRMRIVAENIILPNTNSNAGIVSKFSVRDNAGTDRVQILGTGAGQNQGSVRCGRILSPSDQVDLHIGSGNGYDANNQFLSDAPIMIIKNKFAPAQNTYDIAFSSRSLAYQPHTRITMNCSWGWISAASFNSASDDRLKHNEEPITNATDTLMLLNPKLYDKTVTKLDIDYHGEIPSDIPHKKEMGLIAQEVNDIERLRPFVIHDSERDQYGLDYNSLFSLHMKATQELVARITALEATVASLS
jgi:hypothetical protein